MRRDARAESGLCLAPATAGESVHAEPFTVAVPDGALADLRERLRRARLPDVFAGRGWGRGIEIDYLANLLAPWRDHFDWRAQERADDGACGQLPPHRAVVARLRPQIGVATLGSR